MGHIKYNETNNFQEEKSGDKGMNSNEPSKQWSTLRRGDTWSIHNVLHTENAACIEFKGNN